MPKRVENNIHVVLHSCMPNRHFPNSTLPVLVYKKALALPGQKNKAAEIARNIFLRNGWSNSWKNGIYDFHHYHSNTHECMGVVIGYAHVILGGPNGKRIKLETGDVIILPAGVAHRCSLASEDFLCIGCYPQGKDYDTNMGTAGELERALRTIPKVPVPKKDPVFGTEGFLKDCWNTNN